MTFKNVLFVFLLLSIGHHGPLKPASAGEDIVKALTGAVVATFVVDAAAHYSGNYHGVFHCPAVVFPTALAAIVGFHRLYAGEWKLLHEFLQLCGISKNSKPNALCATRTINDDFADGCGDSGDDGADDDGGCCSGCCSC